MELTQTNVVLSRIAMVLFLCRNKSSRNVLKIYEEFFWNKRKIPAQRSTGGACQWATSPQAAATPLGRVVRACGAHVAPPPQTQLYIFHLARKKNRREGFIAFYDTEVPPPPVLPLEGKSGVRSGLRRGEIVAIVITNLLSLPIR